MPIEFQCPGCKGTLRLEVQFAGKKVRCGSCQAVVEVPAAPESPGEQPAIQPDLPPPPRGARRPVDDDEYAPRPRLRRPPRSSGGEAAFPILLVVGLVGGGLLLLGCVAGGGVLIWLLAASSPGTKTGNVAPSEVARGKDDQKSSLELKDIGDFKAPRAAPAPTTFLRAVSSKGDFIGGGRTFSYGGDQLTVSKSERGVMVQVDGWHIEIGAPDGQFLKAGYYPGAKRYAFSDAAPGIDFSGQGRGCNAITGRFVVWEIEVRNGQFTRLAIDFVQNCEGGQVALDRVVAV